MFKADNGNAIKWAIREAFHQALGRGSLDELRIYERTQAVSLRGALD